MKSFFGLCVLVLAAASPGTAETIRVHAQENPPFFYRQGNQLAGLEYEILEYFTRVRDVQLEVEFHPFGELLPAVTAGQADLAAAQITITDERDETVDFTASYFPVRIIVVEPLSQTTRSPSDLVGKRVATVAGSSYERRLAAIPGIELVYADDSSAAIAMVASGQADATAVDTVLGLIALPEYSDLHMTLPLSDLQHYGFAVPTGSPLAAELSDHLKTLKGSGIYYRLLEKYLGQRAVEMVRAAH